MVNKYWVNLIIYANIDIILPISYNLVKCINARKSRSNEVGFASGHLNPME